MTPHAFILVPLGLMLFVFSRKWLYRLMVASTLFSGTAVFNLGSGDGASGVQVWMFFGSLWLLREAITRLLQGRLSIRRRLVTPATWLGVFLFMAAISLVMPLYINGHLQIGSATLTDNSTTPLIFTSRHITAWLYIAFGILLAISLADENSSVDKLEATGRVYLCTGVFVSLWGFFQLLCPLIGLTYPAFIFNNSTSPGAMGYMATFPGMELLRMSSVALETSIMSQALLTVLPLTFPALLGRGRLISIKSDRYCALLIVAALIGSTSSSAYAGLLFVAVATLWMAARMKINRATTIIKMALLGAACVSTVVFVLYTQVVFMRQMLDLILFAKGSSYSALERLKTIELASGYFSRYPLLGVGWGSVTSHDLLFKLLADVGLIGFMSFAGAVLWLIIRLNRDLKGRQDRVAMIQMAWLLSLTVLIFTNVLSGFAYVLGHMWFTFGMAITCATLTGPLNARPNTQTVPAGPQLHPEGTLV
ncbi:MAG TPA: O-antigen ligase family protein [Acidisarcina sp.]